MANKIFDELLLKGIRSGQMPARSQEAKDWYRAKARELGKINETSFFKSADNEFQSRLRIGHMFTFYYDPKHKDTLPYYDRVPLIFPINQLKGNSILGINLHYLPFKLRAKLMDSLYDTVTNEKFDETTKLKISYKILNSTTKFKEFKPCIKQYLPNHIRSKFMYIHPTEWDICLFLDLARFEKASQTQVWEDSKKIIRKNR
ncbi:MAG: hypothetical protein EKK64_00950 [Neisseriaceae bacterium]|nr:MAG: hypothetical protein EKK64_00950 [Neisseriaceae bacterium]